MLFKSLRNKFGFTTASFLAAIILGFYFWQNSKLEFSQKSLTLVAKDNFCPVSDVPADEAISVPQESKIYFVGCGGFF